MIEGFCIRYNEMLTCHLQSKSSLEMMESQSCDAEPPPPPKPELRYPGLTRGNTEGKAIWLLFPSPSEQHLEFFLSFFAECSLLKKAPPTPTMYKYRPSYSPGENHTVLTHAYANQVRQTCVLASWYHLTTQIRPALNFIFLLISWFGFSVAFCWSVSVSKWSF